MLYKALVLILRLKQLCSLLSMSYTEHISASLLYSQAKLNPPISCSSLPKPLAQARPTMFSISLVIGASHIDELHVHNLYIIVVRPSPARRYMHCTQCAIYSGGGMKKLLRSPVYHVHNHC